METAEEAQLAWKGWPTENFLAASHPSPSRTFSTVSVRPTRKTSQEADVPPQAQKNRRSNGDLTGLPSGMNQYKDSTKIAWQIMSRETLPYLTSDLCSNSSTNVSSTRAEEFQKF